MKCPHCLDSIHVAMAESSCGVDDDYVWQTKFMRCPSCGKNIIFLKGNPKGDKFKTSYLVYPKGIARTPLSDTVPKTFKDDYSEACLILQDSPKASAALSRRCLQMLLRDVAKVKPDNLSKEIDEVLESKSLPSYLAESIDAIRNIGNFATHPIKSTNTGEIVDVEDGEAEWNLDVLEGLFDFYFVQPDILKKKKEALNKKLADAGKPSMK